MGPDDSSAATRETEAGDESYDSHLARSRAVWDRWSDHYTLSERDFEPMREAAIDRLDLGPGDRVLEIGCGPGVNFERLRRDVGEDGAVTAADYSPEMVAAFQSRSGFLLPCDEGDGPIYETLARRGAVETHTGIETTASPTTPRRRISSQAEPRSSTWGWPASGSW